MRLIALFFLIGNVLVQLRGELASLSVIAMFLCLSLGMTLLGAYNFKNSEKKLYFAGIALSAMIAGILASTYVAKNVLDKRLPESLEGQDLILQGKIIDIPDIRNDGTRFRLKVSQAYLADNEMHQEKTLLPVKGIVRLGWFQHVAPLKAGEIWQFRARLKRPSGFVNPGGFDYEKWLFTQGISATGYVRSGKQAYLAQIERLEEAPWWSVNHWRQVIQQRIQNVVANKEAASILSALVVAERSRLNDRQWQLFRDTGTSHLIAISGLHIAVVAGFAFLPIMLLWQLFPRLNERVPLRVAGSIAGVFFATAYALMAGFSLPTQRALLMVVIALVGLMSRRNYSASQILAVAMLAVLLLDPLAPMGASFWLSFVAVALILIFLKRQMQQTSSLYLIKLQLVLSLAMLPLTLFFFNSASISAPLANLFAIPWVSFIVVPLGLLAVVLMPFSAFIAGVLFNMAALAIEWLMALLAYLNGLPFAQLSIAQIPWPYLLAAFMGALYTLMPRGFPGHWLGIMLILPALLFNPPTPAENTFKFTLLDVGQGMAAVIQTQKHVLIYDTGTRLSDTFDIGKLVLIPYLKGQGLKQIDTLIISHEDNDHRGGAASLLKAVQVNSVLSSAPASILPEQTIKPCQSGQEWQWDGIDFKILSPDKSAYNQQLKDNNMSCVLRVSNQYHSLLLTADIETNVESELIKNQPKALKVDVLSIPHHGSKTSSSDAFINATSPKLGVIPVGYRNRFHHPANKVLQRYQQHHVKLLDTSNEGALEIIFPASDEDFEVKAYRLYNNGFWRR